MSENLGFLVLAQTETVCVSYMRVYSGMSWESVEVKKKMQKPKKKAPATPKEKAESKHFRVDFSALCPLTQVTFIARANVVACHGFVFVCLGIRASRC